MDRNTRRHLEFQRGRHLANAEREVDEIVRLARDLNLAVEPRIGLGRAEKLAAASASLVRYLSALDVLDTVSGLLGDE